VRPATSSRQRQRVRGPADLLSMLEESELPLASAGTNAVDGGHGWVDKPQLLLFIDAELVPAALAPGQRPQAPAGLGAGRQQEADAAGDEQVPDAVDVEVVLLRLHEGVEQHSGCRDQRSRAQVERPALPRRWVAVAAPDGASRLRWGKRGLEEAALAGTGTVPVPRCCMPRSKGAGFVGKGEGSRREMLAGEQGYVAG